MPHHGDVPAVAPVNGSHQPHFKLWVVLGWVVLGCVAVLLFEEALNVAALDTFPHHDTAACAGADTFCSPDGRTGLTGGAVVFLVGNLAVAAIVAMTLLRRWLSRRTGA